MYKKFDKNKVTPAVIDRLKNSPLANLLEDLVDDVQEFIEDTRDEFEDIIEDAKEILEEGAEAIDEIAEDIADYKEETADIEEEKEEEKEEVPSVKNMKKAELIELGISRGISEEELTALKVAELRDLLGD